MPKTQTNQVNVLWQAGGTVFVLIGADKHTKDSLLFLPEIFTLRLYSDLFPALRLPSETPLVSFFSIAFADMLFFPAWKKQHPANARNAGLFAHEPGPPHLEKKTVAKT